MKMKNKNLREFIILFILILISFNGMQSYQGKLHSMSGKLYLLLHFVVVLFLLVYLIRNYINKGVSYKLLMKFYFLSIPKGAKIAIALVFMGNFLCIGFAKSYYPFYEVGMFRWSSNFSNPAKMVYAPKYYYLKGDKVKVLDLRKESIFLFSDHLGWGYTHEFTFAATYHNKGQKENFEFIAQKMKERGVDTLWVGIQSINYATGVVAFNPDLTNAVKVNQTEKIHYGAIYIPEYQLQKYENKN